MTSQARGGNETRAHLDKVWGRRVPIPHDAPGFLCKGSRPSAGLGSRAAQLWYLARERPALCPEHPVHLIMFHSL